jgi:hypothetical protein
MSGIAANPVSNTRLVERITMPSLLRLPAKLAPLSAGTMQRRSQ